jgi:putative oxidoreductase
MISHCSSFTCGRRAFLRPRRQKLFGWFGGYGIGGTAGFFDQLGLRPGRLHAWAAALAETVGGILLALGLFTPIGAALVIAVMTAAVITVHWEKGPPQHRGRL